MWHARSHIAYWLWLHNWFSDREPTHRLSSDLLTSEWYINWGCWGIVLSRCDICIIWLFSAWLVWCYNRVWDPCGWYCVIQVFNVLEWVLGMNLKTKLQTYCRLLWCSRPDGKMMSFPSQFIEITSERDRVAIGCRSTKIEPSKEQPPITIFRNQIIRCVSAFLFTSCWLRVDCLIN